MTRRCHRLLIAVMTLFPWCLEARSALPFDEVGRFYVQSFAPADYGAHEQNWAVVQDEKGLVYVANGDGVLEYDGVSWRLIPVANGSTVRSLAVDVEGRIRAGAIDELGYLAADSLGQLRYVSLVEHVPEQDRDFADVWKTHALPDGVYFQSYDRLFRWRDGRMEVWRPETRFFSGHAVRDTFYVQTWEGELLTMARDTLRPAPGGATFGGQRIFALLPDGADAYLAITRGQGIFRCRYGAGEEEACARFSPGLTDLLAELKVYRATELADGSIALGTLRGGVVLLDRAGRLRRVLNEASGLRDETVWATFVDRQGGLWLGLNDGLARVEVTAPVSTFDKTAGLAGAVSSVARHRGRLYAATSLGVYMLEPATGFVAVPGITEQCWSLLSTQAGLLAGCSGGVYDLDRRRLITSFPGGHVFSLHRSGRDASRIYLGLNDGLARLELRADSWRDAGRLDGVRAAVRSIAEDGQCRLWMGTETDGVLRLEAPAAGSDDPVARDPVARRFGVADGLPAGWIRVSIVAGRVRFLSGTGAGLFGLDPQSGGLGFTADTTFDAFLPEGAGSIVNWAEDAQGRVWIAAGAASSVAVPAADGGYELEPTALRRASPLSAWVVHAEADGAVWTGGPHGLVRLDAAASLEPPADFPVWIRRVTAGGGSLLFGGKIEAPGGGRELEPRPQTPAWPYQNNALRIAFAAPRYDAPERNQYRTRLDGFDRAATDRAATSRAATGRAATGRAATGRAATDDGWSAWSTETDKDYTNLSEGRYVFRVQARDVYGFVSREDAFAFRILPPWYRAWWAWLAYGLTAAGSIWGGYRLRTRSLRRLNAELEQRVHDRTLEIEAKNDELEAKNHELEAKNHELERFTYTVSHDLKSPLVTIQGFLGFLERDVLSGDAERVAGDVGRIRGAASQMQRLIDDLLDLSRIGRLANPPEDVALAELARDVVELLAGQVAERGAEVVIDGDLPVIRGDRIRLHQLLQNLLSNALQYMDDQPSPRIEVGVRPGEDGGSEVLSVRDNGAGIAPEHRQKIFELFQRLDSATAGTGVGLALVKRIVEVHGGRIWVESEGPGRGSTFCFTLPGEVRSRR